MSPLLLVCALHVVLSVAAAGPSPAVPITVTLANTTLLTLPENYLGFTLDWWPPTQEDFGSSTIPFIDLQHPRLQGLVAALGPATLRLGGSLDNVIILDTSPTPSPCPSVSFRGEQWPNLCLNMSRWAQLLAFAGGEEGMAPGSRLVLGLPLDLGSAPAWNGAAVRAFLAATAALPASAALAGLEVGEETNPAPGTPEFTAQQAAYTGVKAAVGALAWPSPTGPPLVLGPCSGMGENYAPFNWSGAFLSGAGGESIGGYVMHSYNNNGGEDWKVPGLLNQTAAQAAGIRAFLDAQGRASLPLWCGECGPHNGGGLPNITTRAISSFWYTDALHGLPRLGVVGGFNRQTLAGGRYGLLGNDDFAPHPDYFAALAFARLSGRTLVNVSLGVGVGGGGVAPPLLRVYASCASPPGGGGGVVIAWVNADPVASFALSLQGMGVPEGAQGKEGQGRGGGGGEKLEYHFAPVGGDPLAETLALNGVPLEAVGNGAPEFTGMVTQQSAAVVAMPWTFGYVVYREMVVPGCANTTRV
jgi:heparanase 1